jgi:chromate reductase, NAD(P)H dehydrogenase (quinone)
VKKVLAISGSMRRHSTNHGLISAIRDLAKGQLDIELYNDLTTLPHFNPDEDNEHVALVVTEFRKKVQAADGVIVCTPEYAMGVPGTLKNALDWCVSSSTFSKKPVLLITASSVGEKGHASLLDTLRIIEANVPDEQQLLISFVKAKVTADGVITDKATFAEVQRVLSVFVSSVNSTD